MLFVLLLGIKGVSQGGGPLKKFILILMVGKTATMKKYKINKQFISDQSIVDYG